MTTHYEIALKHTNGRAYFVAFTARRTKSCLADNAFTHRDALAKISGISANSNWQYSKSRGWFCGDWSLQFTGRTQFDIEGAAFPDPKLPSLEDGIKAASP
jgi:hypothetical protein